MSEETEGVTSIKLTKKPYSGPVGASKEAKTAPSGEQDTQELTKEDFERAADEAEGAVGGITKKVQEGTASVLGSLQETLAPKSGEQQDPEVRDFRAAAAEAAAEAKAYMRPGESKQDTK